jgi:hypothetical protein
MQVTWKKSDLSQGLGHGVEVKLILGESQSETLGFIEGYSWYRDKDPKVKVYIDQRMKGLPNAMTTELRLAMLLFLTDKKRQNAEGEIHGFRFLFNA